MPRRLPSRLHLLLPSQLFAIFFACALMLSQLAHAQEREFHAKAKAGTMTTAIYPNVLINGKPRYLAANAQIRNTDNTIVTPNSLIDGSYPVRYMENDHGEIYRIWLLTADEAESAATAMPQRPTVK